MDYVHVCMMNVSKCSRSSGRRKCGNEHHMCLSVSVESLCARFIISLPPYTHCCCDQPVREQRTAKTWQPQQRDLSHHTTTAVVVAAVVTAINVVQRFAQRRNLHPLCGSRAIRSHRIESDHAKHARHYVMDHILLCACDGFFWLGKKKSKWLAARIRRRSVEDFV